MEITKIYSQAMPATRFIGKKYGEDDRVNGSFGAKWGEAFGIGLFETIEAAAGGADALRALYEDGGAYIGLMYCDGKDYFEYWIGEFTPVGTPVPEGLQYVDFPAVRLGVGWLYGVENDLYCHEGDVLARLTEAGMTPAADGAHAGWVFERYGCPRFTTPDAKGNVILDICFILND